MSDKDLEALKSEPIRISPPVVKEGAPLLARDEADKPLPESQLSQEQKEIRRLQDALAKKTAKDLENAEDEEVVATSDNKIFIHVVVDGFTALGRVWYRGQEIEFDVDGQPYQDTKDCNGRSWLSNSEEDQMNMYKGVVKWRRGPWPGKPYEDPGIDAAERKRRRAAPALPRI